MLRVLLRIWPEPSRKDVVALEKAVTWDGPLPLLDQGFFVADLAREVPVYRIPEEVMEGYDAELHLTVSPDQIYVLASKGWSAFTAPCKTCQRS